jgi:hypothetical protein
MEEKTCFADPIIIISLSHSTAGHRPLQYLAIFNIFVTPPGLSQPHLVGYGDDDDDIPLTLYPRRHLRYSYEVPTFYQNYLAMKNTADVTGCKPIAV